MAQNALVPAALVAVAAGLSSSSVSAITGSAIAQAKDANNSNLGWTNLIRNVTLPRLYGQTGTLLGTGPMSFTP